MKIRPLLLGHRGARAEKSLPENTPASFDLALASGCDGFEFDVRLTADGEAVLCHDENTRGLEISKCPRKELCLPTLREVLVRYQRTAFLDIELKVAGLERITTDLLRSFPPAQGFVVSSFLPGVLEDLHRLDLHRLDPTIALGLICETPAEFSRWNLLPIDYVIPHRNLVREDVVSQIKAAGKRILVWTVNAPAEMKQFSKWGVDGIISDIPQVKK